MIRELSSYEVLGSISMDLFLFHMKHEHLDTHMLACTHACTLCIYIYII